MVNCKGLIVNGYCKWLIVNGNCKWLIASVCMEVKACSRRLAPISPQHHLLRLQISTLVEHSLILPQPVPNGVREYRQDGLSQNYGNKCSF